VSGGRRIRLHRSAPSKLRVSTDQSGAASISARRSTALHSHPQIMWPN